MKTLLCLCLVLIDTITSYPHSGYRRPPQRAVMFGSYYGYPIDTRSYMPQGSVSFASGDTIATNSFAGDQFPEEEFESSAEETTEKRAVKNSPKVDEETLSDSDTVDTKSKRIPKRKPQDKDEDDEDMPSSWPFQGGRNGAPSYNAFFPIMFGGSGGGKSRSGDEGYYPGSATAIANSFSTGKGGVATSHATSFGDPYLTSLFRNGGFNNRKAKPTQMEK